MGNVFDVTYDDDGNVEQFLLLDPEGEPETLRGTPENLLLYDPEDALPFDGGLRQFLSGDSVLKLSEDPKMLVGQAGGDYSYVVSLRGEPIETMPSQAEDVLRALYTALTEENIDALVELYRDIISGQVRRNVINVLYQTFDEPDRISITGSGWLIDEFYLVDWDAKMYYATDDPDEPDYIRDGNTVKKDKSYEFVRLKQRATDIDDISIKIGGDEYELTERELTFLGKVKWLLNRRHYHPDNPFWEYTDAWAELPEEEPDLDTFEL